MNKNNDQLPMSNYQWIIAGFVLLFSLLAAMPVLAQEPTFDEINAVAEKMNCPTCQSLNLADCHTQTCAQWRDQIADMLAEGYTQQEVLDIYAERYGDEVLQEPPRRGVGLAVWILPLVAIAGGAGWLAYTLQRWSLKRQPAPVSVASGAETSSASETDDPDNYLSQVEQDLKNL